MHGNVMPDPQQDRRPDYLADAILAANVLMFAQAVALHRAKLMRYMTPTERGLFIASRGKRFFHDFLFVSGVPGMFVLGVFTDTGNGWLAGWLPVAWLIAGAFLKVRWHRYFWASRNAAWDSYLHLRHGKSLDELRQWSATASQADLWETKQFMEYWTEPVA
jgi:hypothetical protein